CCSGVQNLQSFRNISHTNTSAADTTSRLDDLGSPHTYAIVLDLDDQLRLGHSTSQKNTASFNLGRQPMFDRVLHQGLKKHTRHHDIQRRRLDFSHNFQLVSPESHHLNIEIVVDKLQFFT